MATNSAKVFYLFEEFISKNISCVCLLNSDDELEIFKDNIKALKEYFSTKNGFNAQIQVLTFSDDLPERISAIAYLQTAKISSPFFLLTTKTAIARGTIPPEAFQTKRLKSGKTYSREELLKFLINTGYDRVDFVDDISQFAVRGEIIDVWSPGSELPYRIVLSDSEIESIRQFEVEGQRSKKFLSECELLPAKEHDTSGSLKDYLEKAMLVSLKVTIFVDTVNTTELPEWIHKFDVLQHQEISEKNLCFHPNVNFQNNFKLFLDELKKLQSENYNITLFCNNVGEQERLLELLEENKVRNSFRITLGSLHQGFYHPTKHIAFIGYDEIFGRYIAPPKLPKFKSSRVLEGLWEISVGDYVVHEKYGIGKYKGLKQITIEENTSEYLHLEYRYGDKLYVPVEDFHKVQKYIGIEGSRPKLYSLDTAVWEKAKAKAKESAFELAKELHQIYTARKSILRTPFSSDTELEKALENSFIYEETPDQLEAIKEVKSDMRKPYPMNRLVLGDVGFGKTEVAIRASLKCALSSNQTAVLVPTTVLAEQHYYVFLERLKSFPVNIALLTRFQSKVDQKKVLVGLKQGIIDIVIGTHRLLQKDVEFKHLGLLIIDDEHKFGVKHKEQIKVLKRSIDVLSLTATPIPRTLSMALSGIKDLSLIETPPEGRLPIETYIGEYNEEIVKKSITAEVSRNGQVFYIHNYIYSIETRKKYLERLLPEVKFAIVHGRMNSKDIEKTMWEFSHGKIQCLIATTLIEAGLDLPNVNTLIIEKAEEFGLSQLYQLRGRIGRGRVKAYCYIFYSAGNLTEEAKKRLQALYEFTRLGSGFRLALRDMEIRGAGELLGKKQHGFVKTVGLELYCKLLTDEINKIKGVTITTKEAVPKIELNISAFIPQEYISQDDLRIMFYRKFIGIDTKEELQDLINEFVDRFGKLPEAVRNLVYIVELRLLMKRLNLTLIKQSEKYFEFTFAPSEFEKIPVDYLVKTYKTNIQFIHSGFRISTIGLFDLKEFLVKLMKNRSKT
ncbi:MAG: transcription-repair coupling factor [Elusimicrobiota bacterium]|nr:transcription-repair coupling factor [Elusimicrobiota bacterium]